MAQDIQSADLIRSARFRSEREDSWKRLETLLARADDESWRKAQPNIRDGAIILEHLQQWEMER